MAFVNGLLQGRQAHQPELPPGFDPMAGVQENRQLILGVSIFSIILATAPVIGRLSSRKGSKLPWKADDYLIIIATFFSNVNAACYIAALNFGFGYHIFMLQPDQLLGFFKIAFVTFQLYGVAVTFVKLSVLCFYRRVFPNARFKAWLIVLGTLSLVWWVLISLVSAFQCMPVQKAWDATLEGYCIPYLDIFIGIQVANIILDAAIICLPITAVLGLQMSKANKISVAATFGLGGLSIVFAIVRLVILVQDKTQTDITYATPTANWSLIEPSFEIFCACLPCLQPVLKVGRYFSSIGSRMSSPKKYASGGSSNISQNQMASNRGLDRAKGAVVYQAKPLYSQRNDSDVPLHSVAVRSDRF